MRIPRFVRAGLGLVCLLGLAAAVARPPVQPANASQPAAAVANSPQVGKAHRVPYRMSETLHLIVRAKLNGKGPFNFIVDTGAPVMFVTTAVEKQVNPERDDNDWATFEKMELEGGAIVPNAKARVEDIFQIRGMNSLGLPGVRLDGVLGYNILARFRMEFDLSKTYMTWTELDFDPPLPEALRGDARGGPDSLEKVGDLMQVFGAMFRRPEPPPVGTRGSLGVELTERDSSVVVKSVLPGSPAASAGIKADDVVRKFAGESVRSIKDVLDRAATIESGELVMIEIQRRNETMVISATTGKGF